MYYKEFFLELITEASIWPISPEDWLLLYSYSDLSNPKS